MNIRFIGQSCFLLQTSDGVRIVTDPFHSMAGMKMPKLEADIVTTSHDHFDHNNTGKIQGNFAHFNAPGEYSSRGVSLRGIASFHDAEGGRKRGANTVFVIEADGLRLCHLGDLGHIPDDDMKAKIGPVDVLLVPVGEVFTFPVDDAVRTVKALVPKLVIPMHYKQKKFSLGLEGVQKFLKAAGGGNELGSGELDLSGDILERGGVLVMEAQA